MNKIMLITTEGCLGCAIAKNSINEAIKESKKSITFEERDATKVKKQFLRTFGIVDFPAILFFKDEELKVKKIGSVPAVVILRWIYINFD